MPHLPFLFHLNPAIAAAGLLVGFVVGLTGMGGGALATPILILLFRVAPLAAVSSDLVASLVMKPFGGGVHLRAGTVRKDIVRWLMIGSIPAAFAGVLLLRGLGTGVEPLLKRALGLALLASAGSIIIRAQIQRRRDQGEEPRQVVLRRAPTIAIGAMGGLIVGMTSVGSGSLIIVMLLLLYPGLSTAEMVGTDLVQAIPLVASAALAHALFGQVRLGVTASLVLGGIPGVLMGARLSARAPDRLVRPTLFLVLVVTGLKMI